MCPAAKGFKPLASNFSAGILTDFKGNCAVQWTKGPPIGHADIFQTSPNAGLVLFQHLGLKFPLPISGNRYIHFTKLVRGVLLLWPLRLLPVSLFLCHICCTPARHPAPPPSHSIGDGYREYRSGPKICASCPTRHLCTCSKDCAETIQRHIWKAYGNWPATPAIPFNTRNSTSAGKRPLNGSSQTPRKNTPCVIRSTEAWPRLQLGEA